MDKTLIIFICPQLSVIKKKKKQTIKAQHLYLATHLFVGEVLKGEDGSWKEKFTSLQESVGAMCARQRAHTLSQTTSDRRQLPP